MKKTHSKSIADYIIVYCGCILQAFAVTSILKPGGLVVGGFTGISLILAKLINIKYTFIYYTLCILVLAAARFILGKKEALKIILLSTTYPIILIFFDNLNLNFIASTPNDKLLHCIYYGIIAGIGMGLVLKKGFSQGSSDTLAKIIHKKIFPYISIGQILLIFDICVLAMCGFVFDHTAILYAIIMQTVYTKAVDTILFGFGSPLVKMVILSNKTDEISNYILNTINRGVSIGEVLGAYSNTPRRKVILICSTREAMVVKDYVAKIDKAAFINLVPVIYAWGVGNGFDELQLD